MIKNGTIPENITIFSNGKIKPYRNWEDLETEEENFLVIPAYAVDTSSEKMMATAKRWAEGRSQLINNKYVANKELKFETRKNSPFDKIKIIGLEHRSQGGRAYKVITPEGYYFDLREDVLLDTILNEGISKGGELGGQFIWGKTGSQMKIVRVNSKLHNQLITAGKRKNMEKINPEDLKEGGLYISKRGERAIFLGLISTIDVLVENANYRPEGFSIKTKRINKAMLWFNIYNFGKTAFEQFTNWFDDVDIYRLKTIHMAIEELEIFELPDHIIDRVSGMITDKMLEENFTFENTQRKIERFSRRSEFINMVPFGRTPLLHPIFKS